MLYLFCNAICWLLLNSRGFRQDIYCNNMTDIAWEPYINHIFDLSILIFDKYHSHENWGPDSPDMLYLNEQH